MIFEISEGRCGKFVLAVKAIGRGETITRFAGEPVVFEETKKLKEESFALQVDDNKYLVLDEPCCWFNHSCEPVCGLKPDLELVALREIEPGEELSYDYSTTMQERNWTMECRCNKPRCRGRVRDFDLLPEETKVYYLSKGVVQQFIVDRINRKE